MTNNATSTFLCLSYKETLAPLYHSGATGGPGGPKCSPCETTKLICQTPLSVSDDPPCTFPTCHVPEVKISVPIEATGKMSEEEEKEAGGERAVEDPNRDRGEPQEVAEEEEVDNGFRLLTSSCVCVVPVRQPLEVGENEDCSQAVSPGTPGICSCGSESRKDEKQKEDSGIAQSPGDKSLRIGDRLLLSRSDTATAPLVSLPSPLTHSSSSPPCSPLSKLGPRPGRDQAGVKCPPTDSLLLSQESDTLTSPKMTSPSPGDPSKLPMDLSLEQGRGLSCGDSRGPKLSSAEAQLECSPESLHSQLTEPPLTSGWSKFNINARTPVRAEECARLPNGIHKLPGRLRPLCLHDRRVSSVHLNPQFSRSQFAVRTTRKSMNVVQRCIVPATKQKKP